MCHLVCGFLVSAGPANDFASGQMPESRSATTMPAPAFFWPPWVAHAPRLPVRPRKRGVFQVSAWTNWSFCSSSTRRSEDRSSACSWVRAVENPLAAIV
ncbi:MAG: hypothetical protein HYU55_11165 [Nocardioides sp.]|nr:hypothetical protein [Nocardioides sp.]